MISRAPMSRSEHLAASIEEQIRLDRLSPGDAIGTLDELRTASGYSKPTVSEAVRLLRDRGILTIRPGRGGGLFVTDRGPVVRLRHTLLSVAEAPTTVGDAVELREHLELLVDQGAARCRTDSDVRELRDLVETMGDAPDWAGFMAANWALHERIALICPNEMARAVYISTLGHLTPTTPSFDGETDVDGYREMRQRAHVDLVEAISSGEVDRVAGAVAAHADTANAPTEPQS
ncbi:FadR/GntR family transcriptional regulator [Aeromicrobium sp. CF4.19]|uniref:FadR/GntR family transcriptional regulator n=1 Tax=Aeromicrobium sp. CF4.19 TaxID=3373082 RepID=UPI003EE78BB4